MAYRTERERVHAAWTHMYLHHKRGSAIPRCHLTDRLTENTKDTLRHSTAQHSTAQSTTTQHTTAQHSTALSTTTQHSTAQQNKTNNIARYNKAEHDTIRQHSTDQL